MRIAIIGQQDFGKAVLEAFLARGDEVVGVFCRPEKPGTKPDALRLDAQERGLPLFQFRSLRTPEAVQALRDLNADLGVMAYVLQFAPQDFVNVPRLGTIQFHPSLLPRHRGPSSISWPIALGEKHTGITIFRPDDGLDEGPIVLQRECAIGPDETLGELYFNKLFPMGVAALLEAADQIAAGEHRERPQDETLASYEGWMHDDEARIHWNQHVDHIYNLIRACNPAPGAWMELAGQKVRVFDARKVPVQRFHQVHGRPGDVVEVSGDEIEIVAHGGHLRIVRLKPEGGAKMSAGAYAREQGIRPSPSGAAR